MFKKPKRHFRQRKETEGSDEENSEEQLSTNEGKTNISSSSSSSSHTTKSKKRDENNKNKPKVAAISFEDEEEEAFQVKKSSQSRKIVKRLKRAKKDEQKEKSNGSSTKSDTMASIVLNGDRALDMDLDSDCEQEAEEKEDKPKHAFRSVLERGEIPDANLIHLARKKRAMAREQGEYIPLEENTAKVETAPKSTQRLVRDDDNDIDEDDDRVEFSVNAAERDRQHMKDRFLAAEHGSDEDSDKERDEWEQQQLQKVVGGRAEQIPVEPVEDYNSYYSMTSSHVDQTQMSSSGGYTAMSEGRNLKPLPNTLSVDQIKKSLTERLENLHIVHRVHTQERDNVLSGLTQSRRATDELENKSSDSVLSKLNTKYTFMQQLRSYLRDLLDCFNEKYGRISEIDAALMTLAKARADRLCRRRQDDIRDEANDCSSIKKPASSHQTPSELRQEAIKTSRVAHRKSRRDRRRRARLSQQQRHQEQHEDGLSSDDEEINSDVIKYQNDREKFMAESRSLLDDVVEEFSTVSAILDKFADWKRKYSEDYNDAYVGLCLPKLLSPLIKLSLLDWNPLQEDCTPISSMSWYRSVALFGSSPAGFDPSDPDNELIPMIVEKVLVPKLTGYVDMVWDPVSVSQTKALSSVLHEMVDSYPTLNSSSKNTAILLQAIVKRMNTSLDEDTFMPLYGADLLAKVESRAFLHRQIWHSIKLYKNILTFSMLLSDSKLRNLSLDSLLNRYIMLGLQCAGTDNSVKRIKAVTDALPSQWLKSASGDTAISELENLCRYMKSCANTYHQANNRDDLKTLLKIFVNIHAHNHAKWMSDEFSLRMPK